MLIALKNEIKKILQGYEENINEEVEERLKTILNIQYDDLPHFLNKDLSFVY